MEKRDLDDIYIRVSKDGRLDRWESRCLTDCTWEQVMQWLVDKDVDFVTKVAMHLHQKLRELGDRFHLTKCG